MSEETCCKPETCVRLDGLENCMPIEQYGVRQDLMLASKPTMKARRSVAAPVRMAV